MVRERKDDDKAEGRRIVVHGLAHYSDGTVEVLRCSVGSGDPRRDVQRTNIVNFSHKARSRLVFLINTTEVEFQSMLTLTYGKSYPLSGRIVKKHLNNFLVGFRRKFFGEYLWFLEFQERGAPHFHMLTQVPRISPQKRKLATSLWCNAIGLGEDNQGEYYDFKTMDYRSMREQVFYVNIRPKHWEDKRSEEGMVRYVVKYATKPEQKEVPECYRDVGRFYGTSRGVRPSQAVKVEWNLTEDEVRDVLRQGKYKCSDWEYLPKYAFSRTI